MNELLPDPVDVIAPAGAVAWSPSRGFITDTDDLWEARGEGEHVLTVTDTTTGDAMAVVAAVEGDAPLAVSVRQDRQIALLDRRMIEVAAALAGLADVLGDIARGESGSR
jgi:hypothetical protein